MNSATEPTLLPCPFCNDKLAYIWIPAHGGYSVICGKGCGAEGPVMENEERAAEAWNRRPDMREGWLREALAELLESELSVIPPYEAGKEAQDAWADRRAVARNNAKAALASPAQAPPAVEPSAKGEDIHGIARDLRIAIARPRDDDMVKVPKELLNCIIALCDDAALSAPSFTELEKCDTCEHMRTLRTAP